MRPKPAYFTNIAVPTLRFLPLLLAVLAGAALAFYRFGFHVLDPGNIGWFQGDSTWHFLVWHFFRREAWGFPPGQVEGFMAPLGTSIGSADALPLFALPLKLFERILPPNFQYLGPWLFICYMLQGIFGYLLARIFCQNRWVALLVALFFLFSPIMIFRAGHIALSSHWILLFALWHYFASASQSHFKRRTYIGLWLLVTALVGLIHPYLAAMVFPIMVVSLLREWRFSKRLTFASALGLLVGLTSLLALEWWLSGLIGTGQNLESWGFDYFSMNLNAIFNPSTHSRVLPSLPINSGQYEGYAYLGLGMLGLASVAGVLFIRASGRRGPQHIFRRLRSRGHLPLAILAFGFALFSVGKTVTFGTTDVVDFGLFTNFKTLVSTFRAPGRFFWPVYYLLYLIVLAYLVRRFPRSAALLLGLGLAVQIGDLRINTPFPHNNRTYSDALRDKRWAQLVSPFDTIAVIPAFERTTARRGDYADFAYLAANQQKRLTTGVAARAPLGLDGVRLQLEEDAIIGPRDPGTLYVFSAVRFATSFLTKLEPGLRCYELDCYVACHSGKRQTGLGRGLDLSTYAPPGYERISLANYLDRYDDQTLVIAVKEGIGNREQIKDFLKARGFVLAQLVPQGSYVAILHHGRVIFEKADADDPVKQLWKEDTVLDYRTQQFIFPRRLNAFSAGTSDADGAVVRIEGDPLFRGERGLNIAVLDDQLKLISHANFDTYVTDVGIVEK